MGGKSGPPKVVPEFTGLQVNTAVQVLPVPIIYGAPRININLIYYNGFRVSQVKTGGGGKGGGGGKDGQKQTQYNATLIMSAGEGILQQPLIIYQDQGVYVPDDWPTNGAFWFEGDDSQVAWNVVSSTWPADARSYKDTAYYALFDAQLDNSATVPQLGLVLPGIFSGTSPLNDTTLSITTGQYDQNGRPISFIGNILLNHVDADPAQAIVDYLTNLRYGAGFPIELLNTASLLSTDNGFISTVGDNTVSTYCQAVGLAWSVAFNNVEGANTTLERLCKNLVVAPVWDGELLSFIPYYDQYCGDNPGWSADAGIGKKYFNPYIASIIFITQDQILQSDQDQTEDPITFARTDPWKVFNVKRIDFKDRFNFFNDVPAESKADALVDLYGPRIDNIGMASEFSLAAYAQKSADIQLRRSQAIRRTFKFSLSALWAWLTPMELINIPDPANLNNFICVRITEVEDDEEDKVTVTCEEFPLGAMAPTSLPSSPTTPPNQGAVNAPTTNAFPPIIIEPTNDMLTATGFAVPQVIIGASGGFSIENPDGNWGGAFTWVSLDNVSYQLIGQINGASIMGVTTSNLPAYGGSNPDLTDTLLVNLAQSSGKLTNFPALAAANGASLCVIKDASSFELFSFENAILTSPSTYTLSRLYRGLYGTTPRTFGAGAQFLFLGLLGNYLETALPPQYVGHTFYVKLQSFNGFNTWTQDLDTCVVYVYTTTGPTPVYTIQPMEQATTRRLIKPTSESITRLKPRWK